MITRSKLVEQLRDFQIRSQHKCPALTVFSPKPFLSSRVQTPRPSWGTIVICFHKHCSILFATSYNQQKKKNMGDMP
ncbi:hypothetical protein CUMW_069050 [Citrus unshiu]|nr:hypothetical protein CUMW_069050 [Citrus unshiu]